MKRLEQYAEIFRPGRRLIEADAGTGKTHTIIDAVIWLAAHGYYRMADFLLITFTRAATEEMRGRLRQRLQEVTDALKQAREPGADRLLQQLEKADSSSYLQRLEQARRQMAQAAVCTIHSFCQQVLLSWPQLCGFERRRLEQDVDWVLEEVVADYLMINQAKGDMNGLPAGGDSRKLKKYLELAARHFQAGLGDDEGSAPAREFAEWGRTEVRQRLEKYGLLTYDELILRVTDALKRPGTGAKLTRELRRRYRAVLVDEFQDTDLAQWEILRRVWLEGGEQEKIFFCLVGDPKQSIYAFRSADVYVCAEAKRLIPEADQYTLSVNHRSDGRLVEALNLLLLSGKPRDEMIFDLPDFMALREAIWPREKEERFCRIRRDGSSNPPPAVVIKWLGGNMGRGQSVNLKNKGDLDLLLPDLVAGDVARLLNGGYSLREEGGKDLWRPLGPADVAVLVQENETARKIAHRLRQCGLPVSLAGSGNVLESEAACWLERLLLALEQPHDLSRLKALAACGWLAFGADELSAGREDPSLERPDRLQQLQSDVFAWAQLLQRQGLAAVMQRFMESPWVEQAGFYRRQDAGRLLADTRHLVELLCLEQAGGQRSASVMLHTLSRWKQNTQRDSERFLLRLEESARVVRVLTVHRAKGLQFPVVLLPDFWQGRGKAGLPAVYHRKEGPGSWKLALFLKAGDKAAQEQADKEALQEKLRLFYVALTRARHQLLLYYAPAGRDLDRSPAGIVLCRQAGEDNKTVQGFLKSKKNETDQIREKIAARCDRDRSGRLLLEDAQIDQEPIYHPRPSSAEAFRPAVFQRQFDTGWAGYSFSSFVRRQPAGEIAPEEELDEVAALAERAEPEEEERRPRGRRWGVLVHRVLEQLDSARLKGVREPPPDLLELIEQQLRRENLELKERDRLARDILSWLNTPLGRELGDFCLADIASADRLAETSFVMALPQALESAQLLALAGQAVGAPPPPGSPPWAEQFGRLSRGNISGLLNGKIDLVFRRGAGSDARYFLLDYKTNHLGQETADYACHRLVEAMAENHYFLQLVFYCSALHRFLKLRLDDYCYRKNFGGALYVFLYGLAPAAPGRLSYGVLLERPREDMLERIDEYLTRGRAR